MSATGRGDFGGIDNEALDFSQLEDYINDEGNDSNIYFHEALVGGDLKLNDSPIGHQKTSEEEAVPSSASPTISSTSPDLQRHPTPSLSNDSNFGAPAASQQGPQRSSSTSCGSPTVSTSQSFKLAVPTSIATVQQVYHPSHHLPDSPPDSGSEPPFSPNNEEQKLTNGGLRSLKAGHSPHPHSHQRLLNTTVDIMMQPQAESLKHFITYSGTQPLKHLSENTSLCIPSSHSHQITSNLVSGGPHLTTTSNTGVVLTQLGTNIPPHLSSQLGSIPNSPQLGNLVQSPHQQSLLSHSHLSGIYGGSEEFLCDSLSNTSSINNPTKKRKLSDSPKNAVSSTVIGNGIAHIKRDPDGLSPEPTSSVILNPSEDEYSFDFNGPDNSMFMDSAYQCIRFQPFQPNTWHALYDISTKELSPPNYRVDADKGFNFSNADEAFVCQKKNHFQVTVHIQAFGDPRYIKTPEGLKKVESFQLHFHGAKVESPSQTIKVEQSQSDRSKKPFYPVPMDLSQEQVIKTTVGRLHFSETTSNNMRKKGKPNPDQRYFYLVVGLFAHIGEQTFPIIAHASERIIVRVTASNPGQFENDMELSWQKGTTPESIYHAGRVGINTDRPDESLVVHGNIRLTGHIIQPSDARAKTNVQEMDSKEQLKNVANMKIVKYEYRPEFGRKAGLQNEELRGTGVIAQEVQFILPDAVREAGDVVLDGGEKIENFLVVNKERIFMENVGAVKELCKVTDNLETRIDELERINRKLTKLKRLDSLKSTSSCSTVTSGSSVNTAKKANHHTKKHQNRRRSLPNESVGGLTSFCGNRIVQATIIILVLVMTFCIVSVASLYILDWQRRHAISKSFQMDDKTFVTTQSPHYKDPTPFSNVVGPTKHAQGTGSEKDTSKFAKENDFSASPSFSSEVPPKPVTDSWPVVGPLTAKNNGSYAESADNLVSDHQNDTVNSADVSRRIPVPVLKPQSLGAPAHCQVAAHPLPTSCVVKCCNAPANPNEVFRTESMDETRSTDGYTYSKATDIMEQPRHRPENNTRVRAGLEGRSLNLSLVDHQSLSGEDRAENEAIPSHEVSDAWLNKTRHQNDVYFNRSSNMYQASSSSYLDQSSGIQDVQDNSANTVSKSDQENQASSVPISTNNEKDMTHANSSIKRKRRDLRADRYRRSDTRNQFSKNAAKELSRSVESIRFPDWNSTLTSEYCLNLPCIQKTAYVYNYLIPISKYMDQDYVTIQLNFASPLIVDHCISKEKTVSCAAPNSHHYATEHRSSTHNNVEVRSQEWRIPVGFFIRSGYRFRVMSKNTENTAPCTLPDEERGRTFIEYNLVFQRKCDK